MPKEVITCHHLGFHFQNLHLNHLKKVEGHNGFEELKRYIKQSGDFCKDVVGVLQERSELEMSYAKSLSKLSNKIARASRDSIGTLAHSWQVVASEMESEGELHKNLAYNLVEEIVKPLKFVIDDQHKRRKAIETVVDKQAKTLQELRNSETKAKKNCFSYAKETERVQDQLADSKVTKGKILSDKDVSKLESKLRKAEEAMKKADNEYYSLCLNSERSRLEWESEVLKGSDHLQVLEEDRATAMQEFLQTYTTHMASVGPKYMEFCEHLQEAVGSVNITSDIQQVIVQKGTGKNVPEQILPDFFAEDLGNKMNKDRRRESIEKLLLLLKHDIEREQRGKQGVEKLARVVQETPTFGDEESPQDFQEKIQHIKSMLTYLEATRFKLQCSLSDIENRAKPSHPLSKHIEQQKDKQGMIQTILKVPSWARLDERRHSEQDSNHYYQYEIGDRGSGDGTTSLPDTCDEFSVDSEPIYGNLTSVAASHAPTLSKCRALYDYEANLHDELSIRTGDIINVHSKQDDGWWQGELKGVCGIFPATYVEEIK